MIQLNQILIHKTLDFINHNSEYSEEELIRIEYGLEGVYLTISKVIVILVIGIIFHYIDTILLTLLFFNILRFFAFGLHAKKSWHCLVLSILQFNLLPFIFLHIEINPFIIVVISIFTFLSFLCFAPSDTVKRPLTNKRKRIIRKILSLISFISFLILLYFIPFLKVPILCAFIIESVMINPIAYKLLGLPYNNYKKRA